jgi:hypothetical protein
MGFPDWFLFDWTLPSLDQMAAAGVKLGILARILLHLAALVGLIF